MRSIYDNTKVDGPVAIYATTNAAFVYGPGVDTQGYNSGAIRVATTVTGTGLAKNSGGSVVAVLEESSDNSTWAAANDNTGTQIQTSGVEGTTTAALGAARIEGLGVSNRLRYLRVKLTANGFANSSASARFTAIACIELGRAYNNPTTTATSNT